MRHRWQPCLVALAAWAGAAGATPDDLPREVLLLAHFKQRMQQVLAVVPNYTCLQTIQRSVQYRRARTFTPLDTVLLEISNLGDKELLAWPGARRLEDTDIASFAGGGLINSGLFALLARNIFVNDTTVTWYSGEEVMGERAAARYGFRTAEVWSGYYIRGNGVAARVGITGSFWIDPASMQLIRIEVHAAEIPASLQVQRTSTIIDYAPMHIGASDVLLPQAAQTLMTLLSGEVRRNDVQFSHCREYGAESSIRFDAPDPSAPAPTRTVRTMDLPAGLLVPIELETAIDSATAHVGDPLRGHVASDVRGKNKTVVIPKGAVLTGRIREMERLRSPEQAIMLTIELAELEWENMRAEFYGELQPGASMAPARIPGTGVLHLAGTRFHLAAGFRMNWRTLEPNDRPRSQ